MINQAISLAQKEGSEEVICYLTSFIDFTPSVLQKPLGYQNELYYAAVNLNILEANRLIKRGDSLEDSLRFALLNRSPNRVAIRFLCGRSKLMNISISGILDDPYVKSWPGYPILQEWINDANRR